MWIKPESAREIGMFVTGGKEKICGCGLGLNGIFKMLLVSDLLQIKMRVFL